MIYLTELLDSDELKNAKLYIVINEEDGTIKRTDKLTEEELHGIENGYLRVLKIDKLLNTFEILIMGNEYDEDLELCLEEILY